MKENRLALPREAHDAYKFKYLPQSLGKSNRIVSHRVSRALPKLKPPDPEKRNPGAVRAATGANRLEVQHSETSTLRPFPSSGGWIKLGDADDLLLAKLAARVRP